MRKNQFLRTRSKRCRRTGSAEIAESTKPTGATLSKTISDELRKAKTVWETCFNSSEKRRFDWNSWRVGGESFVTEQEQSQDSDEEDEAWESFPDKGLPQQLLDGLGIVALFFTPFSDLSCGTFFALQQHPFPASQAVFFFGHSETESVLTEIRLEQWQSGQVQKPVCGKRT